MEEIHAFRQWHNNRLYRLCNAEEGAARDGGPCANPQFFHDRCRLCIVVLMDESARVHVAAEVSLEFIRVLVGS